MIRVNVEIIRHRYFVIDRNAYVLTQMCKWVIINLYLLNQVMKKVSHPVEIQNITLILPYKSYIPINIIVN